MLNMKNLKLVMMSLLMMYAVSGRAQQLQIKKGENAKNSSIDKFVGTWHAKTDSIEVTFYLSKENVDLSNYKIDMIVGFHTFKLGENIVSDNSARKAGGIKDSHVSFSGSNIRKGTELKGYFKEDTATVRQELSFKITPDGKTLIMTCTAKPEFGVNLPEMHASRFPRSLTLMKR
jgi:hypothetical protein